MKQRNKLNSDQRGVIHHLMLFLIVGFVVAAVGFAGWRVWQTRESAKAESDLVSSNYQTNGPILLNAWQEYNGRLDNLDVNTSKRTSVGDHKFNNGSWTARGLSSANQYSYGGRYIVYSSNYGKSGNMVDIKRFDTKTKKESILARASTIQSFCLSSNRIVLNTYQGIRNEISSMKFNGSNRIVLALVDPDAQISCGDDSVFIAESTNQKSKIYESSDSKKNTLKTISSNKVEYFCGSQYQANDSLVYYDADTNDFANFTVTVLNTNTNKKKMVYMSRDASLNGTCLVSPDGKQIASGKLLDIYNISNNVKAKTLLTKHDDAERDFSWMATTEQSK